MEGNIQRARQLDQLAGAVNIDVAFSIEHAENDAICAKILGDGDVAAQTERVLKNLSEILEAAGSGLGKVVRSTVFLKNMNDFAAMNQVYGKYFSSAPPARSTVEVARLPKDVLVEIDVIALA